jgi:hypothetical protein
MWTTDRIARYNPTTAQWTFFDTPVRGTEIRHVSLHELPSEDTKVTVPLYRNSKMGAMTLRIDSEIAALKAQASKWREALLAAFKPSTQKIAEPWRRQGSAFSCVPGMVEVLYPAWWWRKISESQGR